MYNTLYIVLSIPKIVAQLTLPFLSGNAGAGRSHKPTRVRTVLNEKQLHTLRTCYNANPRPDALMKEQLVEMTLLSPRYVNKGALQCKGQYGPCLLFFARYSGLSLQWTHESTSNGNFMLIDCINSTNEQILSIAKQLIFVIRRFHCSDSLIYEAMSKVQHDLLS